MLFVGFVGSVGVGVEILHFVDFGHPGRWFHYAAVVDEVGVRGGLGDAAMHFGDFGRPGGGSWMGLL